MNFLTADPKVTQDFVTLPLRTFHLIFLQKDNLPNFKIGKRLE